MSWILTISSNYSQFAWPLAILPDLNIRPVKALIKLTSLGINYIANPNLNMAIFYFLRLNVESKFHLWNIFVPWNIEGQIRKVYFAKEMVTRSLAINIRPKFVPLYFALPNFTKRGFYINIYIKTLCFNAPMGLSLLRVPAEMATFEKCTNGFCLVQIGGVNLW